MVEGDYCDAPDTHPSFTLPVVEGATRTHIATVVKYSLEGAESRPPPPPPLPLPTSTAAATTTQPPAAWADLTLLVQPDGTERRQDQDKNTEQEQAKDKTVGAAGRVDELTAELWLLQAALRAQHAANGVAVTHLVARVRAWQANQPARDSGTPLTFLCVSVGCCWGWWWWWRWWCRLLNDLKHWFIDT